MLTSREHAPHPPITSREEWLVARKRLLDREKALTRQYDRVNADRRRLPMIKLDKEYSFQGPDGEVSLRDLFHDYHQLIVYHFMFDPKWDKGCSGCTGYIDAICDLSMLNKRDTHFVCISRAPLSKLERYKHERGWHIPWYSSYNSDFNYDYHVTLDESVAPIEYNYRDAAELARHSPNHELPRGEAHGLSVFFRTDDAPSSDVFHTYSAYARGVENLTNSYALLDRTPYGRQESFEDSPPGWPQSPTYG